MASGIVAELMSDHAMVKDQAEASQIYNKGYFGTPQSGGTLKLDLLESLYLLETRRISMRKGKSGVRSEELMALTVRSSPSNEIKYLVYHDMRQRGYVVRAGSPPADFNVLPRGGTPGKSPARYLLMAISERASYDPDEVEGWLALAGQIRKEILIGVVDEEGDLTYYVSSHWKIKKRKEGLPKKSCNAVFLGDRAMIFGGQDIGGLEASGHYGKERGENLQLSLIETAHLMDLGRIDLRDGKTGRKISLPTFKKRSRRSQPDFDLRLKVYEDLKGKGLIVKTGFKYGVHFRVYDGDPDDTHARYLVHSIPEDFRGSWPEMSRAVRLAQGVKKEMVLARPGEDGVSYITFKRIRP